MNTLLKDQIIDKIKQEHTSNLLVTHLAGSHAYGMATPESDVDVRGVFCASKENIWTPFYPVYEKTLSSLEDAKIYELRKFTQLYTEGNPNILETLWVDKEDILTSSPQYDLLRTYRYYLLSKKVAFTFSGYAISQLKRMKGHKKWINNPQPVEPPKPVDFVKLIQNFNGSKIFTRDFQPKYLCDVKLIPYGDNIFGAVQDQGSNAFNSKGQLRLSPYDEIEDNYKNCKPVFIVKFCKEEYRLAKEKHSQYWEWKNNRNEKRAKMEEDFGFDGKHAVHLVRLLKMCEEILNGRGVIVKRPDAAELLAIRNGDCDYNEIVAWAEEKDKFIREKLYHTSALPKTPDIKLASKILMAIQDSYWNEDK